MFCSQQWLYFTFLLLNYNKSRWKRKCACTLEAKTCDTVCLYVCWTTEAVQPSGNIHSTERGFCAPLVVALRLLCINLQVLLVISSRYMCSGLKLHYLQCCFNLEVFHLITILIILRWTAHVAKEGRFLIFCGVVRLCYLWVPYLHGHLFWVRRLVNNWRGNTENSSWLLHFDRNTFGSVLP